MAEKVISIFVRVRMLEFCVEKIPKISQKFRCFVSNLILYFSTPKLFKFLLSHSPAKSGCQECRRRLIFFSPQKCMCYLFLSFFSSDYIFSFHPCQNIKAFATYLRTR